MLMNRFKLEEILSQLGNLQDDIDTVIDNLYNNPYPPDEDEITNTLIGIKTLHKLRLEEAFRVFEHLIEKGDLK